MKTRKILFGLFILIIGVLLTSFYIKLLNPDPYFIKQLQFQEKFLFLWTPMLLIPLLYLSIVVLFIKDSKKAWGNFALFWGIIILCLLVFYPVADIRYAMKSKNKNKLMDYHPYLQLTPNYSNLFSNENIDSANFIIYCLGGSTTEFKDKTNKGWPKRVEEEVNKITDNNLKVYNLGRQWYTSLHTLISYETNLRQHSPDAILVMHAINDLLHNADFSYFSRGDFRGDYGHFLGPVKNVVNRKGFIGDKLELFFLLLKRRDRKIIEQNYFKGLDAFKRNINTLIDIAKIDSVDVILMTQPHIYSETMTEEEKKISMMVNFEAVGDSSKWSYLTALAGMQKYNEAIRAIASERNVFLVDLDKEFPKSIEYFIDDVHYNDTAFDIISRIITDSILQFDLVN